MGAARKAAFVVLAVVVVLPLAVVLAGGVVLNTDLARGRILEAVQRATGHAARIDGRIGVAWSLAPAFSVDGVALLNPPGFSREVFVSARRVEARVALLPLLQGRIEIPGLWIEGPDALLERDSSGRGNWLPPVAPPAAAMPVPVPVPRARMPVVVQQVQVANGTVAWAGGPMVQVRSLRAAPAGGAITGSVVVNGVPAEIVGSTQAATAEGVPFEATGVGGGLALSVSGRAGGAAEPIAFEAKTADLATLGPLVGRSLPSLRDVVLTGQWGPGGPAGLKLVAGAADLGAVVPGLSLVRLEGTMAAPDQPVRVLAQAALRGLPVAAAVVLGRVSGAIPVQAQVTADGATFGVQGSLSDMEGGWTEAVVTARVPDLARTGALAGVALPGLHDVALDVRMLPGPGGQGVLLRGLRVTSAQGDVAGDLAVGVVPRLSVRGSLVSQRLDLDGLMVNAPVVPVPAPAAAAPQDMRPAAAPVPAGWVIPDRPLPFDQLRRADADVGWSVASLMLRGVAYQTASVHVVLRDGRLRVDPAGLVAPGGPVQVLITADAGASPPSAALRVHGLGLDAAGLSAAAGAAGAVTGTVDIDVDVHGAGATAHAMAASLDGRVGVSLTEGEIENEALAALFGPALRGANIPLDAAGRSKVRCMAMRVDATNGQAVVKALGLDTSKLRLDGDGTVDLGQEVMDLHLRPTIRLGPTSVAVPVHLSGPWRSPKVGADKGVIAPGRFGISIGAAAPDPCGPALAAVHHTNGHEE
jgi:AsmA protein